jgi:hypothetical protein
LFFSCKYLISIVGLKILNESQNKHSGKKEKKLINAAKKNYDLLEQTKARIESDSVLIGASLEFFYRSHGYEKCQMKDNCNSVEDCITGIKTRAENYAGELSKRIELSEKETEIFKTILVAEKICIDCPTLKSVKQMTNKMLGVKG